MTAYYDISQEPTCDPNGDPNLGFENPTDLNFQVNNGCSSMPSAFRQIGSFSVGTFAGTYTLGGQLNWCSFNNQLECERYVACKRGDLVLPGTNNRGFCYPIEKFGTCSSLYIPNKGRFAYKVEYDPNPRKPDEGGVNVGALVGILLLVVVVLAGGAGLAFYLKKKGFSFKAPAMPVMRSYRAQVDGAAATPGRVTSYTPPVSSMTEPMVAPISSGSINVQPPA